MIKKLSKESSEQKEPQIYFNSECKVSVVTVFSCSNFRNLVCILLHFYVPVNLQFIIMKVL